MTFCRRKRSSNRRSAASKPAALRRWCITRAVLRLADGRNVQPSAAVLDSRTVQSTPECKSSAGYDSAKRKKGGKLHIAVDTLDHLLSLHMAPANEQGRAMPDNWPKKSSDAAEMAGPCRSGLHR
jgi:hypothetical protein